MLVLSLHRESTDSLIYTMTDSESSTTLLFIIPVALALVVVSIIVVVVCIIVLRVYKKKTQQKVEVKANLICGFCSPLCNLCITALF